MDTGKRIRAARHNIHQAIESIAARAAGEIAALREKFQYTLDVPEGMVTVPDPVDHARCIESPHGKVTDVLRLPDGARPRELVMIIRRSNLTGSYEVFVPDGNDHVLLEVAHNRLAALQFCRRHAARVLPLERVILFHNRGLRAHRRYRLETFRQIERRLNERRDHHGGAHDEAAWQTQVRKFLRDHGMDRDDRRFIEQATGLPRS